MRGEEVEESELSLSPRETLGHIYDSNHLAPPAFGHFAFAANSETLCIW